MENKTKKIKEKYEPEDEEDIDFEEMTSHKVDKNVSDLKSKKRLIVILEHA